MPYQPFTFDEVQTIFTLSEKRPPALGAGGIGHAGERHVSITNRGLSERLPDDKISGLAAYTAFLSFEDQVKAALELLNLPANDTPLEHFRQALRPSERFSIDHCTVPTAVKLRYGTAGGGATFPCATFSLHLRKDLGRPRGMHVVTFYGTMGKLA